MDLKKILAGTSVAIFLTVAFTSDSQHFSTFAQTARNPLGSPKAECEQVTSVHSPRGSTPAALAFVTVSARLGTSYPVISRP
jgi:hypothetical protein